MKNFPSQLEILDISEGASKLFPVIKKHPEGVSVLRLSKIINKPRATIYGYVDELIEKGLVKKGVREEGSFYFSESRENVALLFEEKKEALDHSLESLENAWGEAVSELYKPKFFIYEGENAYKSVFRDMLSEKPETLYGYWPINSMFDLVPEEELRSYHRKRIKAGTRVQVLWPTSRKISKKRFDELFYGDEKHNLREIRLLPKGIDQTLGYMIYGNKVAFISSDKEQYGFVIDSKDLTQSLKSQFEYIWKQSKKY